MSLLPSVAPPATAGPPSGAEQPIEEDNMKKNIRRTAIVGGVVGVVAAGGAAFAAFTATGAFQASGTVHDAPVSLTADGGSIQTLYPGGCSDVTVTFGNSNDHDAKVDLTKLNTGTISLTSTLGNGMAVLNPNWGAVLTPAVQAAGSTFTVPAGKQASFTVPNLVCLSKNATNADAGKTVSLSGTVPFVLATDSEYNG
jgi:hypothetical protein